MLSQTDARRMSIKTDDKRDIAVFHRSGDKDDSKYNDSPEIMFFDMNVDNINLCIIFNHSNFDASVFNRPKRRTGSEKDQQKLECNLRQLNFTVQTYENLKINAIKRVVDSVSDLDGKILNCVMFIVMTYGEESNNLWAYDGQYVPDDITNPFIRGDSKLAGIPKLFFFQACRPKKRTLVLSQTDGKAEKKTISMAADILVMYSTLEGYLSYRDKTQGSWFIQALATALLKSIDFDILHILTLVINNVFAEYQGPANKSKSQLKQIPEFRTTLTKCLKFVKYEKVSESKLHKIKSLPEILKNPNIVVQIVQSPSFLVTFMDTMKKFVYPKKSTAIPSNLYDETDTQIKTTQCDSVALEAIPSTSSYVLPISKNTPLQISTNPSPSCVNKFPIDQPSSCHATKNEINASIKLPLPQPPTSRERRRSRKSSIKSQESLSIKRQEKKKPTIEHTSSNKIKQNITHLPLEMVPSIFLHSKDGYGELVTELFNKGVTPESVTNLEYAIQLDFCTLDGYKKAKAFLDDRSVRYHCSLLSCLKFVIRGIPENIKELDILNELRAMQYPVARVERMKQQPSQTPLPSVIVELKRTVKWERMILKLTKFLHLEVSVELLDSKTRQSHKKIQTSRTSSPENFRSSTIRGHQKARSISQDHSATREASLSPVVYRQRRASSGTSNTTNSTVSYRAPQRQTIHREQSLTLTTNRDSIPVILAQFMDHIESQKRMMEELFVRLQNDEAS